MDAAQRTCSEKKQELLIELAELMIEEQVEEGLFLETPHYSIIELASAGMTPCAGVTIPCRHSCGGGNPANRWRVRFSVFSPAARRSNAMQFMESLTRA